MQHVAEAEADGLAMVVNVPVIVMDPPAVTTAVCPAGVM